MRFLGWGGSDQPGEAVNSIVAGGVIAIVRLPSADVLVPAAEAIREGGVAAIEVTPDCPWNHPGFGLGQGQARSQRPLGPWNGPDARGGSRCHPGGGSGGRGG